VLNAHLPFVSREDGCAASGEQVFFEALSDTYLPLIEVCDHLDGDHIPFRLAVSLSPILCHMLNDEALSSHYLEYVDKQIDFGVREIERTRNDPDLCALARLYYDRVVDKRILYTERYNRNPLKALEWYQKKGRVELLTTAASHAFLPIYAAYPEAIQAQIEAAIASHRGGFGRIPQGFWLPELGWTADLDEYLRSYNFSYTVVDTHAALLGNPQARRGSFYPIKTPSQVFILTRDHYAFRDIMDADTGFRSAPVYRDCSEDAGYELPAELVRPFLGEQGIRTQTGYKYRAAGRVGGKKQIYNPQLAREQAENHARAFLEARISRLNQAGALMAETPISLCAYDADTFGRFWYEGPEFLETLFREGAAHRDVQFMNPAEYLFKQELEAIETVLPEFSSWGTNGYAETWLDASNDWMYRHAVRSLERMIELAERFPNDSGLKERALNQAAREILLVQSSDWPRMLYHQESPEHARSQIEMALRNFTTIYEALGSNYISTEWLTTLEKRHNFFPHINYRVFRRKK
jgi:1,4-alpha-glucan branching enzyme